jgi:hypothetical protein
VKREILDKRNELYEKSLKLRGLAKDCNSKRSIDLMKKQDELYKRWKFYSNILKANDKIKRDR